MFTGIITGVGTIASLHDLGSSTQHGKRLTISAPDGYLSDVGLGDSIALNGACMTVTSLDQAQSQFTIDISAESLARTAGLAEVGRRINLEKALRAHDRLGGHIVSGHVDGVGTVTLFAQVGESWELRVLAPAELARFLAYKGSITINGVSLTVCNPTDDTFQVAIIPYTFEHTNFHAFKVGSVVNLEFDIIGKYISRMIQYK